MTTPLPLREADLTQVQAVFTDVDGTLTTHDRLESATLASLEALREAGVKVVLVSGRPAGWGECWLRQWPVDGVIVENGGLHFARGSDGAYRKVYAQPDAERLPARERLEREVAQAMTLVPGARLSTDSAYTEVDLAIDYNEEVKLGAAAATTLENALRARGVQAVRSSVHVNCWIGDFDKLSAVKRFLDVEWGESMRADDRRWVYAGDSFNDAPMFGAFPLSVGVANVQRVLEQIDAPPKFITPSPEGAGFRELAQAVLAARR